jgi:hypothetical protein
MSVVDDLLADADEALSELAEALGVELDQPPSMTPCEQCGRPVPQPWTGRPRQFCSGRCRSAAHRARHALAVDQS